MSEPTAGETPAGAEDLTVRYARSMLGVFGAPQRVLMRGEGALVWDAQGREYLDLLGGIAVNALGHAHPSLVAAMTKQVESLAHVSNFFATPTQIELAETLLRIAGAPEGSGVFFTNSGTESNEAAFKLARRTERPRILALENAFHGRTMGALALTHKEAYRAPFEPLPGGVEFVPPNDTDALARALAPGDVGALFLEPIQGEAGVVPLDAEYLRAARELTAQHGTLLILDEVQTGIARTGHWFAHQGVDGVVPDVMTLAKGLGGGFPIGAVIAYGPRARALLQPGQHGTTFGGNPLGAAVALSVLGTIAEDDLLGNARRTGRHLADRIRELAATDPRVLGIRGEGLLRGIALADPLAPQVVAAALEAGFIINAANPCTLRLAPPLIITSDQLDAFVDALPGLLDAASAPADTGSATTDTESAINEKRS
ncbi:acetylornithine transaminase [Brachybacterium subflavum]|uniref:acetylornithine transaminase n=1 Tax=Brachybacterium subflavum TaxID=2585206 RepID=UPI001266531C|nr:acetylornithine transaminase [Brachybacterium subflavum]